MRCRLRGRGPAAAAAPGVGAAARPPSPRWSRRAAWCASGRCRRCAAAGGPAGRWVRQGTPVAAGRGSTGADQHTGCGGRRGRREALAGLRAAQWQPSPGAAPRVRAVLPPRPPLALYSCSTDWFWWLLRIVERSSRLYTAGSSKGGCKTPGWVGGRVGQPAGGSVRRGMHCVRHAAPPLEGTVSFLPCASAPRLHRCISLATRRPPPAVQPPCRPAPHLRPCA